MATQYVLTSVAWTAAGVVGAVTATVAAPDGTQVAYQASSAYGTGWQVWLTPQQVGTYTIGWASTGGQVGTTTLVVAAAAPAPSLLTLQDCYATLKVDRARIGDDPVRDADMLDYARAALVVVEGIVGPVAARTITEWFGGDSAELLLTWRPRAIVSVTANGTPLTGWVCDFQTGILRSWGGWPPASTLGVRNIAVTYQVGSGRVRPNVYLGVREVFRQLWERSRVLGGGASVDTIMQGFAVPNAVYELLGPSAAFAYPGFA